MRRWIGVIAAGLVLAYAVGAAATTPQSVSAKRSTKAERTEKLKDLARERGGPNAKTQKENRGRFSAFGQVFADEQVRAAVGDAIAKALSTTREELTRSLRQEGGLEALMKSKGLSEEQLGAAIAAAIKPLLARLVNAGRIDQAAVEQLLGSIARGEALGKIIRIGVVGSR